jgi:hypothetical protein
MADTGVIIVFATAFIPLLVAWSSTRSTKPFRVRSAHPWAFFWSLPFALAGMLAPVPLIFRSQQPPATALALSRGIFLVSLVIIVGSAVQGLRHTFRRSQSAAMVVVLCFILQGTFGLLLSGGPALILGIAMADGVAVGVTIIGGVLFAGWLVLMAVASERTVKWLAR